MLSPHFLWYKASLPLPIAETGKWRLRAIKQPAQGKAAHTSHALSLPLAACPPSPQPEVAAPSHGATLPTVPPFPRCTVAVGVLLLSQPHTYTAHVLVGMSVSDPILQMVELRP